MTRETWTLYAPPAPDGYVLTDGWVRDIATRDGLYATPEKRGSNGDAGQGHGELWAPKAFAPGGFAQQLWLLSDMDRGQVERWYDDLLRVALWPYDLVRIVRGLANGTQRECYAELVQSVEPEPLGQLGMRMGLEWGVPAGFWQDVTDVTAEDVGNVVSGTLLSFSGLAGGTAPMDNLTLTLTGPYPTTVRLTQPLTREWVQVQGGIPAGQTVTLDCATGAIGGTADVTGDRVTYSGHTYLELPPLPDTVPLQLRLTYAAAGSDGGGVGPASRVSLAGRRRWFT